MFTIAAFHENLTQNSVEMNVAAVPDQHLRTEGDGLYIGKYNKLFGAVACVGPLGLTARLVSPSLRRINPMAITPVCQYVEMGLFSSHMVDINMLVELSENEALEALTNSTTAAAVRNTVVVFLADQQVQMVAGRIFTVHFQFTITPVIGQWTFGQINFIDELPVGNYSVVGANVIAPNGVAFRFVPVGSDNRPGCITAVDEMLQHVYPFRLGNLGKWFDFNTVQPPGIELLNTTAPGATTFDGYMDILVP